MLLDQLQALLSDLYALEVAYDVNDFLITDERIASALDTEGRSIDEKLLISEGDEETAGVSLYLKAELLERLRRNNPSHRLDGGNLNDFWTALEGISHFLYYAWNADKDKSVTLLEMELQAEVDKFVTTSVLLHRQGSGSPAGLHRWLFAQSEFDGQLSPSERVRYEDANRYAGKYCRKLVSRLGLGRMGEDLRTELRRFYRLSQPAKIQHIEAS
jgi:hypothetical protein